MNHNKREPAHKKVFIVPPLVSHRQVGESQPSPLPAVHTFTKSHYVFLSKGIKENIWKHLK